jgi:outer membrane protein assembly factor BamC
MFSIEFFKIRVSMFSFVSVRAFPHSATLAAMAVVSVGLCLAGCSVTETLNERNKIDYKSAGKLPPLDIPPDLTAVKPDERFTVPERSNRTLSGFEKNRANPVAASATNSSLLVTNNVARIERAGSQRWLTVALPAEKVWPVLREFWQESGFQIEAENQGTAILETNWAENRAKLPQDLIRRTLGKVLEGVYSTSERDKFRSRIERGVAADTTEIYISHRGMIEVYTTSTTREETRWQPRPSDPELEVEFLQRLLVKLGASKDQADATVAGVAQTDKARINASNAADSAPTTLNQISLVEPFDRAWRRVGLALDRSGFTVEDRDRTQGLYFVRYIDPEVEMKTATGSKPGFFGNLFTSSDRPVTPSQYRIKLAASGVAGAGATAAGTQVNVLAKDGKTIVDVAELKTANKIIAVLHDQLK